ncbi:MAG: excinuclease ABC subunit UvrB, partial [Firmicutes bacterium]|nr:excinuclease ABC subunit UvrB [Bacillota bacterium]
MAVSLRPGMQIDRKALFQKLIGMQYVRNEIDFHRGSFRAKGEVIDIFPAGSDSKAVRVEMFDDTIDRLCEIDTLTGEITGSMKHAMIFPASHYVTGEEKMKKAIAQIREELQERLQELRSQDKLLEAQRLEQRTNFDLEMLEELGYCTGIENYSRYLTGRKQGEPPFCLLDFFPEDYVLFVDESHVTLPQVRGMYEGDRSRKQSLIEYGFRLPSALDNRPLRFPEFEEKTGQQIYVSATPGPYEEEHCEEFIEQVVRPTGLLDPPIEILPIKGQIDNLLEQIKKETAKNGRVLITTLTKRMAEDLTDFLRKSGVKVKYLHSEVKTLERMEIVRELRLGEFEVLVGINLLREGLDLPEVTLVAILDGDKEGFLRSYRSLIQTIGRAARNVDGRVVIYADNMTDSLALAVKETNRRREMQQRYNEEHGIIPQSVRKNVRDALATVIPLENKSEGKPPEKMTKKEREKLIHMLEKEMRQASSRLEFERAAELRDAIMELRAISHK